MFLIFKSHIKYKIIPFLMLLNSYRLIVYLKYQRYYAIVVSFFSLVIYALN